MVKYIPKTSGLNNREREREKKKRDKIYSQNKWPKH